MLSEQVRLYDSQGKKVKLPKWYKNFFAAFKKWCKAKDLPPEKDGTLNLAILGQFIIEPPALLFHFSRTQTDAFHITLFLGRDEPILIHTPLEDAFRWATPEDKTMFMLKYA